MAVLPGSPSNFPIRGSLGLDVYGRWAACWDRLATDGPDRRCRQIGAIGAATRAGQVTQVSRSASNVGSPQRPDLGAMRRTTGWRGMQQPILATISVLVEGGSVLLVRRKNPPDAGLWGYPGGKVEPGETVRRAAARELAEETGVEGRPERLLALVDVIDDSDRRSYHFVLAAILCRWISGVPRAADDVSDAGWHPVEHVLDGRVPTSRHVAEVARIALSSEREVCCSGVLL